MAAEAVEQETVTVAASEASERGRYAVYVMPDGGWKIATVGPLCEKCSTCGCGQAYRDPVPVPPFAVNMLTGGAVPAPLRAMLGKVMGNGRG
jgi:hypothetical protein